MTPTEQDNELLELCKQVYKRTGGRAMTDTNQASEDELSEIFRNLSVLRPSPKSQTELAEYNKTTDEARTAIQDLIRTEKTKLLAEVRERVVGEDEPGITNIMIAAEHAKQRNLLTKMEAEL